MSYLLPLQERIIDAKIKRRITVVIFIEFLLILFKFNDNHKLMNKASKIYLFSILNLFLFSPQLLVAQAGGTKKLQAGMTGNFGLNFNQMGDNKMLKDGVGTDLSVGICLHTSFKNSSNLGLATGLEFDFQKFGYKAGADSVYYKYTDNTILHKNESGGTVYRVSSRQYSPVYVSIPLMLLFRTDPIGDWKYFGKFGLRNSFLVSQKINDTGVDLSAPTAVKENTNMKSVGETFFYRGSIGFSAGAEWNFIGSTSLVSELGFFYGLTPMHYRFSKDNYTLYSGADNYFYTKARQNQLILKIAILF